MEGQIIPRDRIALKGTHTVRFILYTRQGVNLFHAFLCNVTSPYTIPKNVNKRKRFLNVIQTSEILLLKLEEINCVVSLFFERENTMFSINGS